MSVCFIFLQNYLFEHPVCYTELYCADGTCIILSMLAQHQVLKKALQIAQFARRDNGFDFKCRKAVLLFVVLVVAEAEKRKNST
jgi:hypothetical protein